MTQGSLTDGLDKARGNAKCHCKGVQTESPVEEQEGADMVAINKQVNVS